MLDKITSFIVSHQSEIEFGAGVAYTAAKRISNEKAPAMVAKLQAGLDLLAKGIVGVGALVNEVCVLVGDLVKSDGALGVK